MGIDRHELEHRNWRPSASKINNQIDRALVEEIDTSIVPADNERTPPNPEQVKRVKIDQL
jgi:hypothetical protein